MKTFVEGEQIEFQDSPGVSWRPAVYVCADKDPLGKGWHYVRATTGFHQQHYVPARRIRKVPGASK